MKSSRAFALLAVLFLLSGLGALCWLVCLGLPPSRAEVAAAQSQQRLRRDAFALLQLAQAEVQQWAGADTVATSMDDGAMRVTRSSAAGLETFRLAGDRVVDGVRWSWRCEDISCRFDLAGAAATAVQSSRWARSQVGRQAMASGEAAAPASPAAKLAWQMDDEGFYRATIGRANVAGTDWGGRGLLTDPVRGGWRRDLASAEVLSALVGPEVADAFKVADLREERGLGLGFSVARGPAGQFRHLAHVADLRLSFGVFNARSDGRHRFRFHVSGLLWNPASAPLLADSSGQLYLLEVVGAPEITVRNLDSGAVLSTWLDACPVADFGIFNQYPREAGLWSWCEVEDVARYGMARRGLLPGEAYAFLSPAPAVQPQGLSRVLGRETWHLESAAHGPGWKRPSPQVFLPTDRIEITCRFLAPMSFRFRPAAGEPAREKPIADYPSPVVHEIGQVWFPDFRLEVSGRDYSREDSGGYTIEERRACLRVSWVPRGVGQLSHAVRSTELLRTHWDLSRPEEAAQWVVGAPLAASLLPLVWAGASGVGDLQDTTINQHLANTPGAYADLRLAPLPGWPLPSVGALRHLGGEMDWARLDDSFNSAPLKVAEPGSWSENPRLTPWATATPVVAADWSVSGPFNVNSTDPDAWWELLRSSGSPWQVQAGGPFAASPWHRPFFPTHPAGAQLAAWAARASPPWVDEALVGLAGVELAEAAARQGLRLPTDAAMGELARQVVRLGPECGAPFRSLEAFARSGLLDKALAASRFNEFAPAGEDVAPMVLRGADLLELWAPFLTVRGDTVRVVGQVSFQDPRTPGSLRVEAVLQRQPESHEVGRFGRRWRVIRVRLL
jgi:hypothetical protein